MSSIIREIAQKREKWVEASRENNFDAGLKRLLSDLYPDNAHFIYELLQNAEDALAKVCKFELQSDKLIFEHDGRRLFTPDDIESITNIADSSKKDDATSIGKFGVGFKAVYAYTDTPLISSGNYCFEIRDLVVPVEKNSIVQPDITRFEIPLNNPKKSTTALYEEINKGLHDLNSKTLLFLNNIERIEIKNNSFDGYIERKKVKDNLVAIETNISTREVEHFVKFEKEVEVAEEGEDKLCTIGVAFEAQKATNEDTGKTPIESWKIRPIKHGQVFIYFPAEKETSNLKFHIHAPFASTIARSSVRECGANTALRNHLAQFIANSLELIRDMGLLTIDFLAALPNGKDNIPDFYLPIVNNITYSFKTQHLLPMLDGGHRPAKSAYRGRRRLTDLISSQDLAQLVNEEPSEPLWSAYPNLRNQREDDFLSQLEIREYGQTDLIRDLAGNGSSRHVVLQSKNGAWHQQLYSFLGSYLNKKKPWEDKNIDYIIAKCPIVLLSNGDYSIGKESFFPSEGNHDDVSFPRVSSITYSSGNDSRQQGASRNFLQMIGVREVGETEEIELLLKQKYSHLNSYNMNADLKRFIEYSERRNANTALFNEAYIIPSGTGVNRKPCEVYLDKPYLPTDLSEYYSTLARTPRHPVPENLFRDMGLAAFRIGNFCKKIGCQVCIEAKQTTIPEDHPDWTHLRSAPGCQWTGTGRNRDYSIPEFATLIENITVNRAKLIWNTMNEVPSTCLKATFQMNSSNAHRSAKSSLVHFLSEQEWIPQVSAEGTAFLKPSSADRTLMPKGFNYQEKLEWLDAVGFGSEVNKDEEKQNAAVEILGFKSAKEASPWISFIKDAQKQGVSVDELRNKLPPPKPKVPSFPSKPVKNQERRQDRTYQSYKDSSIVTREKKVRTVRTSKATVDPQFSLRTAYTNEDGKMVCQICKQEMPFKKNNGDYYFEAVEILKNSIEREHRSLYLALCPTCAAMYKEFIKKNEGLINIVKNNIIEAAQNEIVVCLGKKITTIRFVETHLSDLKAILH